MIYISIGQTRIILHFYCTHIVLRLFWRVILALVVDIKVNLFLLFSQIIINIHLRLWRMSLVDSWACVLILLHDFFYYLATTLWLWFTCLRWLNVTSIHFNHLHPGRAVLRWLVLYLADLVFDAFNLARMSLIDAEVCYLIIDLWTMRMQLHLFWPFLHNVVFLNAGLNLIWFIWVNFAHFV